MRTDDVLTQIDAALDDWSVSGDAMRSSPAATPQPARLAPDGRAAGREILIQRLVDRHGFTRPIALEVVSAMEAGRDTPHAELVRAEANAVMRETMGRLREALRPMFESWAEAMRRLAESVKVATVDCDSCGTPARRHDRPAWQSPYGPARRRRPA